VHARRIGGGIAIGLAALLVAGSAVHRMMAANGSLAGISPVLGLQRAAS
jgi:hypothetical protein